MERGIPEVDEAAEFFEILSDFRDPRDAVREAISNSIDAGAKWICIEARIERYKGQEELVLEIFDDGEGMIVGRDNPDPKVPSIKAFFDLGNSTRRFDEEKIGKKGHGTKTYFNSRSIEVWTRRDGQEIYALMEDPRDQLAEGKIPPYDYEQKPGKKGEWQHGTRIVVKGYNPRRRTQGFSHNELRDFIVWFTKFGSVELALGFTENKDRQLKLRGLGDSGLFDLDSEKTYGYGGSDWQTLEFGHRFPAENFDLKKLKKKDPASPTKYFVKKWSQVGIPVKGYPHVHIDMVFYIEGDKAKDYNPMIRRPGRPLQEGMYSVEERYGLWACKDFIPIENVTEWIAEGQRAAYTKFHSFVNCQDFQLTANRGDIGNTPYELLSAIRETTQAWFKEKVLNDPVYKRYQLELESEAYYREPAQEAEELKKRKQAALSKKVARMPNKALFKQGEIVLIEPRQEAGVFALFCFAKALNPEVFDFQIIDYDTRRGFDVLAEVRERHHLDKEVYKFVEFKKTLEKDFSHSFERLASIVCWDCNLADGSKVTDIAGNERTLKIVSKGKLRHTQYMLQGGPGEINIEVFVLRQYLSDKFKIEFRPRSIEK